MEKSALPLHTSRTLTSILIINRLHILLTSIAISALFHYRITTLLTPQTHLIPHLLLFLSELSLTCIWTLRRTARWRPVKRSVYPDRLPKPDSTLPPVDVFICTADPTKEPALSVMNTVISAMALDYPADRLAVYLSDDGGSYVTLQATKEAWKFAQLWVPFSRENNLEIRSPIAYFSNGNDELAGPEMTEIKKRYMEFKEALENNSINASGSLSRDHPPTVEVMNSAGMPYLVYVAREKKPSHPHHFKGGALNALLKVSAMISNAPYFLVLDCDHYCNDPTSARQAMCFFLDPAISQKLAWVQFPQKFRDTTEHDIYGSQLHHVWREGIGWDGLKGPSIYGCNFYMSREAVYGTEKLHKDVDLNQLKKSFGSSNEFLKSIYKDYKPSMSREGKVSDALQKEIQLLASCSYDTDTEWGTKVGYAYFTVVEDSITSLDLHCKGWISVFIDPERPCFLGACTTNMNDMLVQQTRWAFGLTQIALSKYCPLFYGPWSMSVLQRLSYCAHNLDTILTVPFYGLVLVPQICLLRGIPLYPKVSDPYFIAFAFIFISSQLKHIQEVLSYGDSFMTSLYELRVWMMKATSSYLFATINAILDFFGLREANFSLTSKVVDDEQLKRFEKGIYDFQVAPLLIIPCCSMYILNFASFVIGVAVMVHSRNADEMFIQASLPLFGILVNYNFLAAMVFRTDKGRISTSITLLSLAISGIILSVGFILIK